MAEFSLAPFASLIQLWAGICLLFFYEKLLEKSPIEEYQSKKKEKYNNMLESFLGRNQAFLDEKFLLKGYDIIKENNWPQFYKTIQNFATIGFLYSVFLLAYIGIENTNEYQGHYQTLQILNFCILGYSLAAWLMYKTKIFKGYLSATIFFIFLLILFHTFTYVNNTCISYGLCIGLFWSKTNIYILTLFTCFSGVFITLLQITAELFHSYWIGKGLKRIDYTTNSLTDYLLGIKKSSDLPKNIRKKAAKYMVDKGIDTVSFDDFVKSEIQKVYSSFINPWYINWYLKIKKQF